MTASFLIVFFSLFTFCGWCYSPIIDGAQANLIIHVVDDANQIVSNASVKVFFYTTPEQIKIFNGLTNCRGIYTVSYKTYGEILLEVQKEGFYFTRMSANFRTLKIADVTKRHRWSQEPLETKVLLRRKKNPIKLIHKGGRYCDVPYPKTKQTFGFDLVKFDWCAPHGSGEHDDLQITQEFRRASNDWLKVYEKVVITLTNQLDGIQCIKKNQTSEFRYPYSAASYSNYVKEITFEYDRLTDVVLRNVELADDDCLILRIRTRCGKDGELRSARYGILDYLQPFRTLNTLLLLNPEENNPNLEDCL